MESDFAVRSPQTDAYQPRGWGVSTGAIEVVEALDLGLGVDGLAAATFSCRDNSDQIRRTPSRLAHNPRIAVSAFTTCARTLSSNTLRTAPYSDAGRINRKDRERAFDTRMRTISGVSRKAQRPIFP